MKDPSNDDLHRSRNRIRHQILPQLRALNPESERAIAEFVDQHSDQVEYLYQLADEWLALNDPGDLEALRRCPRSLLRAVIVRFGESQAGSQFQARFRDIERVIEQISSGATESKLIELPSVGGDVPCFEVGRIGGLRLVSRETGGSKNLSETLSDLHIDQPTQGDLEFSLDGGRSRFRVHSELVSEPATFREPASVRFQWDTHSAVIAGANANSLRWRLTRSGDSVQVQGRGNRKLKKLFQEFRVPISERRSYPVLVDPQDRIIWVPGIAQRAIDDSLAPQAGPDVGPEVGPEVGIENVRLTLSLISQARSHALEGVDSE